MPHISAPLLIMTSATLKNHPPLLSPAQVVAVAWMKPDNIILSPGAFAHARSNVRIAGCSSKPDAATTPAVAGLSLSKGRTSRWVVDTSTDPPVNETFEGDTLTVLTTWRQRLEPGLRLNVSGEVTVNGSSAPAKAQVRAGG